MDDQALAKPARCCRRRSRAHLVQDRSASAPFDRRRLLADKLCKRQVSRRRSSTPSKHRPLPQAPGSDRCRTAFAPACHRPTRMGSNRAPPPLPMRSAAIRMKRSSMLRKPGKQRRQAGQRALAGLSLDRDLHRGLGPCCSRSVNGRFVIVERAQMAFEHDALEDFRFTLDGYPKSTARSSCGICRVTL